MGLITDTLSLSRWEALEVRGRLYAGTGTRADSVFRGQAVVTLRGEAGRFVIGQAAPGVAPRLGRLVGCFVRAAGRVHWVRLPDRSWRRAAFVIDSVEELPELLPCPRPSRAAA